MKKSTRRLVAAAMFTAIICIATMAIRIPTPPQGYINLGDSFVLLAGWVLSPVYGVVAAGLGSAMADILSGFAVYAPATFIIKGLVAFSAYIISKLIIQKTRDLPSRIISGFVGETAMVLGYYIFEGFMYGFAASVVNIPLNVLQGVVCLILAIMLMKIFQKTKIKI